VLSIRLLKYRITSSEKESHKTPRKIPITILNIKEITVLQQQTFTGAPSGTTLLLYFHWRSTGKQRLYFFAHFCTFVLIVAHSPAVELDRAPMLKRKETTGVCYATMAQTRRPHGESHEFVDVAMA